jgi:hypothetical protein
MRDEQQAILLAKRMTEKDRIQYYVIQNTECGCYDIVLKINIKGRKIIYPKIKKKK